MDRQQAERRLKAMAPEIAKLLGYELIERDDSIVVMKAPEGFPLFFNLGLFSSHNKIAIGSSLQPLEDLQHATLGYDAHTLITVSVGREPDQIARDVENFFLPEWRQIWGETASHRASLPKAERCPYCHGETALFNKDEELHRKWRVQCSDLQRCGARGPLSEIPWLAVEAWNTNALRSASYEDVVDILKGSSTAEKGCQFGVKCDDAAKLPADELTSFRPCNSCRAAAFFASQKGSEDGPTRS